MKTFTIDINNGTALRTGDAAVSEGTVAFMSEQEFRELTRDWPTARLVEVWNKLPGAKPVAKFTDRKTAIRRIWGAIEKMEPSVRRDAARLASSKAKREPKPKALAKSKPAASKTEQVLAALRAASGVTLKQLVKLTGWQPHSVRGFLSAQVSKRMGLRVKSFKRDGERCYRIRG